MNQDNKNYDYEKKNFMPQGHSRRRHVEEEYSDIPEAPSRARMKTEKKSKGVLLRRIIIFSVLEVIALCGIFIYSYAAKQYAKIQRPKVSQTAIKNVNLSSEEIEAIERGYWNIAVFGVDSRNSSVGKGSNSDVIMIVSINRDTGDIKLCSVYRDTYLKVGNEKYNKINSAYCNGGPEQALKALNENLDLNITQYVTFNWKAVATGINILGGVDIDVSKAEFAYINGFITETVKGTGIGSTQLQHAGMNHLDGVQAVAYARLRLMDNDYARTERQRKIIKQCFEKAQNASAQTLNDLLGNMLSMVATNLTWQDGLDAIAEVSKYNIAESTGFPFARAEANMGKCGACVIPQTLESNVRDLHQILFAQENYDPSEQVKNISNYISAKSGYYKEGKKAAPVSTEGYLTTPKKEETASSGDTPETTAEGETKDKDGNFYFNGEEPGESKKDDKKKEKETDEEGHILPGQGDDEEIYGPGGEPESETKKEPTAPGEDVTEEEFPGGPGSGPSEPTSPTEPVSPLKPTPSDEPASPGEDLPDGPGNL